MNHYLLPSGFRDLLPPDARNEQRLMGDILEVFHRYGYEQVSPPFMEFEETLLADKGKSYDPYTFRVMDPISGRMMGIRADMTMQVTRIASSRLANAEKPLRLSYAGRVLRVQTDGLSPERQLSQAGIELIGSASPAADTEVVRAVIQALAAVGHHDLVLDISLGGLLEKILAVSALSEEIKRNVRLAVREKNADRLGDTPEEKTVALLLRLPSSPEKVLPVMLTMALPETAIAQVHSLAAALAEIAGSVTLSVDPLESHGFDYHDGLCFSVFLQGSRLEVARGGRYTMEDADGRLTPATGATLYLRALMSAAPQEPRARVFVPAGCKDIAAAMRAEGKVVLEGLELVEDVAKEAARLGCSHWWDGGKVKEIQTVNKGK